MTTKLRQIERNLEFNIKINTGYAVLKQNNKIEIIDCKDFTIEELEYLINEIKNFILYKEFLEDYYLSNGYINETGNQEFTTNSLPLFKGLEFLNIILQNRMLQNRMLQNRMLQNRISRMKTDNKNIMKVYKKSYDCKD